MHNEAAAREGDAEVYDQIMEHDVYHQLGRPLDNTDAAAAVGTQSTDDVVHERETEHVAQHPSDEVAAQNSTTDMGSFIETEIGNADADTFNALYTGANTILDEFDDPAEFPSDVE